MSLVDERCLVFDGACGTMLQSSALPESAWGEHEGCNEYLNVSAPDHVSAVHRAYFDAGAMAVETNTLGANAIVLSEYGLTERVGEFNRAAVENARRAGGGLPGRYVFGSVGPTTKLPTLRHIGFDQMHAAYREQMLALLDAGADGLIIETCQDLLQAKIALIAAMDARGELGLDTPVMVSLTIETTGTMLGGPDIAAALAALEPYDLFAIGLNCATGPEAMTSHLHYLARHAGCRVSCMPNAGIPSLKDGQMHYDLTPEAFAQAMKTFVQRDGVSIVGGCCGTTPEHISALVRAIDGVPPARREPEVIPSISSNYQAVPIKQEIPPLMIGERTNTNGSKKFRELLLADDFDGALAIGLTQEQAGAHAIDLCTAYAGRDELTDISTMVTMFTESIRCPTVIDSTTPACIEAALKLHPGRCVVNSINLEDGGKNLAQICTAVKRYGAGVIALTINEGGMAMTGQEKLDTARAIYDRAVNDHGLRACDLLFDPLTFTIGSGDESLRTAGVETLNAIELIKKELPGVYTVLGLSNISFGLPPAARRVLNSVFLHEAVGRGLDAAIVDVAKIVPLSQVAQVDRDMCLDLIHDRGTDETKTPLEALIEHFAGHQNDQEDQDEVERRLPEQQLTHKVMTGSADGLEDLLEVLLKRRPAVGIINDLLVPAMRQVGELFGRGEMLLPFVLKSAEVMRQSVNLLEPHMDQHEALAGLKVLLATVQGDVHDIGKNLVDIILSNNGYQVVNLGIKVPAEVLIDKAREHNVDVIGLSGLLVKSAMVMRENLQQFRTAGLDVPVLLGGAALTPAYVAKDCAPCYDSAVVYCPDAFAGLKAMTDLEAGTLKGTVVTDRPAKPASRPGPKDSAVLRDNPVPQPPFLGAKTSDDIPPEVLFDYINVQALFRGRWGYRRGKMSSEDYRKLVSEQVRPLYDRLKQRVLDEGLLQPRATYGYFPCHSDGDQLIVTPDSGQRVFAFPRQADPPHLCIADYFKTTDEGGDVVGLFVVTIGDTLGTEARKLYESDSYHDYLMLHALSVELTDALAEYWHEVMRCELRINASKPENMTGYVVQEYQGSRYGFGYPACPDLDAHKDVFALLHPERIGVTLTETMEMVPEQTASGLIAHHPQAKYFAV